MIIAGDKNQLDSIVTGKAQSLIQNILHTVHLTNIRRQSNETLKQAVFETISRDFQAAFKTLDQSTIEIPIKDNKNLHAQEQLIQNRKERVERMVSAYFNYSKLDRNHVKIMTPGHANRYLANQFVRGVLKREGKTHKKVKNKIHINLQKPHGERCGICLYCDDCF